MVLSLWGEEYRFSPCWDEASHAPASTTPTTTPWYGEYGYQKELHGLHTLIRVSESFCSVVGRLWGPRYRCCYLTPASDGRNTTPNTLTSEFKIHYGTYIYFEDTTCLSYISSFSPLPPATLTCCCWPCSPHCVPPKLPLLPQPAATCDAICHTEFSPPPLRLTVTCCPELAVRDPALSIGFPPPSLSPTNTSPCLLIFSFIKMPPPCLQDCNPRYLRTKCGQRLGGTATLAEAGLALPPSAKYR
ncbi:hypothetical protein P280DRAFT_95852 [Massarina eburnea CBS 473.64]|uniref:Uncharacterized protein n=1 Tax=Massarina eburnea CBS 473.64 TaxID=1395130 RepID=A0A6A6RRB1_9PLEO|nr:hypothetical protein P280DRAFT_95852 [Massarina eburnea CBS 473.64]